MNYLHLKKLDIEIFYIRGGSGSWFPGFLFLENWREVGGGGAYKSFVYLNNQCCKLPVQGTVWVSPTGYTVLVSPTGHTIQ